jgi:hypothetical protein
MTTKKNDIQERITWTLLRYWARSLYSWFILCFFLFGFTLRITWCRFNNSVFDFMDRISAHCVQVRWVQLRVLFGGYLKLSKLPWNRVSCRFGVWCRMWSIDHQIMWFSHHESFVIYDNKCDQNYLCYRAQ